MAVLNYDGEKSFVGAVLAERENNGYNDSDFFALVYNETTDSVHWVEFATTRGGCGRAFGTYVDATDEALDKAEAVFKRDAFTRLKQDDEDAAKLADTGKMVKLTRTYRSKKLKVTLDEGTEGVVFWRGEDQYAGGAYAAKYGRMKHYRVGVEFEAGKLFLSEDDVEVVGFEDYLSGEGALRERADQVGQSKRADLARRYEKKYAEGRARNERETAAVAA